ncbi:hypothetical protein GYH30_023585 [Glycine max]|uniref:Uncharacterized protein n=2 Tax=Glycine subgen. Soja TaxID=1462606 RepID=K7LB20_SOYBN|nr:hypothetical protein GYH30_023585 [Glycine max]RZB89918.1 hypothetical protein D0Y65_022754 [Glycine soja]
MYTYNDKVRGMLTVTSLIDVTTLDLIQQERVGLSAKLSEKRAYYSKVAEDMNAKLQKQQVTGKAVGQKSKVEGKAGANDNLVMDSMVDYFFHQCILHEVGIW